MGGGEPGEGARPAGEGVSGQGEQLGSTVRTVGCPPQIPPAAEWMGSVGARLEPRASQGGGVLQVMLVVSLNWSGGFRSGENWHREETLRRQEWPEPGLMGWGWRGVEGNLRCVVGQLRALVQGPLAGVRR